MAETRLSGFDFSRKTYALAGAWAQTAKTQETSLNNDVAFEIRELCANSRVLELNLDSGKRLCMAEFS